MRSYMDSLKNIVMERIPIKSSKDLLSDYVTCGN
ncbi:hypothetical protein glysoja_026833 [Glycine soja]|uniref:Uncharacterized protein n=1 Tax=Glycine soja TaxID=3848 RepID=A0A0B2Q097_GLYSO|nr:hypothetical protein glysoja_026833 [Glycine soja]